MPITAKIAHVETVGLSAAQVENAPSEVGSQRFDGTAVVLVPITAKIVHAETVGLSAAQVESTPSEGGSQWFDGTAVFPVPITAEIVHAEIVGLSCEVTVVDAQVVSPSVGTTGSNLLNIPVVHVENVHAGVEVVSLSAGTTAVVESLEDEAAGNDSSNTGNVSKKRKARQNAKSSKQRARRVRQREAGAVATQMEEGMKDKVDRASSKFIHDPMPLCPVSACEVTSPSVLDDKDGLVHEAASTDTVYLSAGMLVSAAEVSQTGAVEEDKRAESISPDQFSRPRKSKSARIDDTTPMAMAATDVVLSNEVSTTQVGLEEAEVGTAGVARVESGFSDEEPSSAADPYARPRGSKSARIGGAETNFQITIPAAPVTFNVLIPGDADPRDKKLTGSKLPATFGNTESMGTPTAEPQAVPEKMRIDTGSNNVIVDSNTDTVVADDDEETSDEDIRKRKSSKPRSSEGRAKRNERKSKLQKARKAARISYGQLDRGGSDAGGEEDRRDWQASEL